MSFLFDFLSFLLSFCRLRYWREGIHLPEFAFQDNPRMADHGCIQSLIQDPDRHGSYRTGPLFFFFGRFTEDGGTENLIRHKKYNERKNKAFFRVASS